VKQTFTESVGGISPLNGGAIDGSKRPTPKVSRPRLPKPKPSVAASFGCPECDFVTTDESESRRHLYALVTGRSECGVARSRLQSRTARSVPLGTAIEAYLRTLTNPDTAKVYGTTLRLLAEWFDPETAADQIQRGRLASWFRERWDGAAPATWNRNATALRSFFNYCRDQGWCDSPASALVRTSHRADKPPRVPNAEDIGRLLSASYIDLRERALWRLLFDSAAKPGEALRLNAEELDLSGRCTNARTGVISWSTDANRLLVALLGGRGGGPVFLTERRAKGARAPRDVDPVSGKGRLSYRRAAELFEEATAGEQGGPWTLHQLRHSALTHDAENGASTPMLMAKSGHTSVASLARYARPSAEALQRWQEQNDPARRR
jgi:integrase/recombinase XerC/integrase/recombinase XerD